MDDDDNKVLEELIQKNNKKSNIYSTINGYKYIVLFLVIGLLMAGAMYLYYRTTLGGRKETTVIEKPTTDPTDDDKPIKSLSYQEQQDLFNIAVKEQIVLIDGMTTHNHVEFTDEDIILLLPDYKTLNIFSSYDDFYVSAKISDVEENAKEIFGKTIDVSQASNNSSLLELDGENVIIPIRSGMGAASAELISVTVKKDKIFDIKFKYNNGDSEKTYTLKINYNDKTNKAIYKSIE